LYDKDEIGKNFQAPESRASLGSVNDFPRENGSANGVQSQTKIA
jgi:hypothetical protein